MDDQAPKPRMDRRLLTVLLIVFVQMVGASMALPILPLFARRDFGLNEAAITPIISAFFAAQFIAGPFIGRLSDRYGRVPVLIVSQIGTVIGFLMLATAGSVGVLYAARILDGITGGNIVVAQAYVTDITPKERRTQSLGLILAAFGVGFIVGPALGGALSAFLGMRAPFVVAALAAAIVVYMTWHNLDESLTPEQRAANRTAGRKGMSPLAILSNGPLLSVLLIVFVAQFGLGLVQSSFALFGEAVLFDGSSQQVTDLGIGILLASVGVGQVFTQIVLLDRMFQRFGDAWLVVIGVAARAIALFWLALSLSPFVASGALITFAVGTGLLLPALQSLITNTVDDAFRGGVLGVFQSVTSLAIIISTAIGGTLYEIDFHIPFLTGAFLSALVLVPALMLVRWAMRQGAISTERRMPGAKPSPAAD